MFAVVTEIHSNDINFQVTLMLGSKAPPSKPNFFFFDTVTYHL